ncbi:hypothetical protein CHS0354_021280 [Potamilus streckersoni]|uniref:C2H2-type domain-containing protein n=1 Tax=Potamilus streckersoni TaxID=2493646 RepID=A0AAE0TKE0_9BIVA|nr:hypothetical protein CHS0354_021280 [Potamilus streckersoni]
MCTLERLFYFMVLAVKLQMSKSENCPRDNSRIVRNVVQQKLFPLYKMVRVEVPSTCPLLKERDKFVIQEDHKEMESITKWTCNFCGKAFIGEYYLDKHFDNRHAEYTKTDEDAICLADFCEIFRCDVISGRWKADFWDLVLCLEEDMKDLSQDCQDIVEMCIPKELSLNASRTLRNGVTSEVCSFLTCKRYWDTTETQVSETSKTIYIVFTVFLTCFLFVYYCVALNYFCTDTFSDTYEDDTHGIINPESLSSKKTKQEMFRQRQHNFLETERLGTNLFDMGVQIDSETVISARKKVKQEQKTYPEVENLNSHLFDIHPQT